MSISLAKLSIARPVWRKKLKVLPAEPSPTDVAASEPLLSSESQPQEAHPHLLAEEHLHPSLVATDQLHRVQSTELFPHAVQASEQHLTKVHAAVALLPQVRIREPLLFTVEEEDLEPTTVHVRDQTYSQSTEQLLDISPATEQLLDMCQATEQILDRGPAPEPTASPTGQLLPTVLVTEKLVSIFPNIENPLSKQYFTQSKASTMPRSFSSPHLLPQRVHLTHSLP